MVHLANVSNQGKTFSRVPQNIIRLSKIFTIIFKKHKSFLIQVIFEVNLTELPKLGVPSSLIAQLTVEKVEKRCTLLGYLTAKNNRLLTVAVVEG